ncbi:MAG: hypothetical protein ACXQT3_05555 [Methermicoccaceae archaeon]
MSEVYKCIRCKRQYERNSASVLCGTVWACPYCGSIECEYVPPSRRVV